MPSSPQFTHTTNRKGFAAFPSTRPAAALSTPRPVPISVPGLGMVAAEFFPLRADPLGQAADTIAIMREFANVGAGSAEVRQAAGEVLYSLGITPRTLGNVARAAWRYVNASCQFELDEDKAPALEPAARDLVNEVLLPPAEMLRFRRGDCDDFSTLLAALLTCLGVPNALCAVAADPDAPDTLSHVYNVAYCEYGRYPLDSSHGPRPGWEAPNQFGLRQEWPVWGIQ